MIPLCKANSAFLSGPMRLILPQSSHFAHSLFEPRWEFVKSNYQKKVQDEKLDALMSKLQEEDNLVKSIFLKDDDMNFDRTRCGPQCMSASLSAFRNCENCSRFLAFGAVQPESES